MVVVAVAGGTGNFGRAVVDAFHNQNDHTVKILTRKVSLEVDTSLQPLVVTVNYTDIPSLTKALEDNKVHTIISTLSNFEATAQENLIHAAEASKTTKRFAPSEFGMIYTEKHAAVFPPAKVKIEALKLLKTTSLEYTIFSSGFFLDYYGYPRVKTYMPPLTWAVDMAHNAAAIPGSGYDPIVFTHTFDVAKFIVASVGREKWPERSVIIGEKMTWNEFVNVAEEVKGTKFTVTYDPLETLAAGTATELPAHRLVYAVFPKEQLMRIQSLFGLWVIQRSFDLPEDQAVNKVFPDIKPRTVKDVLREGWEEN
ncbi:NAD(P)-binding protein [Lepidopterella palustris CBS 459.81]|uniref:NAD(P)-binding protein n=1 Tax=Lepidopterella palustris CBS 459.81 TaxID=1314670 RepID=A0A8E2E787_9PEZI|nr:NAD(P)-binding protein [Lepidopterella palustris CBS 459.81]